MKYILIFLLSVGYIVPCFAQENFTLTLELVKPSGKIDENSYFLARLKNQNDSLNVHVVYGGDGYRRYLRCSYFKAIYDIAGEGESITDRKPFFGCDGIYNISIPPSSEYKTVLPLFKFIDLINGGNGILPLSSKTLVKIKRVRIKLENLEYALFMNKTDNFKFFIPEHPTDLYSNWLDIDGREFLPELLKDIRPDN